MLIQDDGVILADPLHKEFNFNKMKETDIADFSKLAAMQSGNLPITMDNDTWFTQVYTIKSMNWKLIAFH